MATSKLSRQFVDVYNKIATGHAVSAGTAIATSAQQTLAVTIPDVALDGTWTVLSVVHSGSLGGVTAAAEVTAAGTVTVYLQNLSGGSVTPAAQTITVIAGQIDKKYTQL